MPSQQKDPQFRWATNVLTRRGTLSIPSSRPFCSFDDEGRKLGPTDGRRSQFFENLVGSQPSEWPLLPLLRLAVCRYSPGDDRFLIRCHVHD